MIDETNLDGVATDSESSTEPQPSLFGEAFVRTGIQRDYIIDLRDAAVLNDAAEGSKNTEDEVVLNSLFGDDRPGTAAATAAVVPPSSNLFERPVVSSSPIKVDAAVAPPLPSTEPPSELVLDLAASAPVAAVPALFDGAVPSAGVAKSNPSALKLTPRAASTSATAVSFQQAAEFTPPPRWRTPVTVAAAILAIGFGGVKLINSLNAQDDQQLVVAAASQPTPSVLGTTTVPEAVAAPVEETVAPTPVVVATTQEVATTVTTQAAAAAPAATTRRPVNRPATTAAAPTTAVTIPTTVTTAAPAGGGPAPTFGVSTTTPPVTVAPTTAPVVTAAPTTAPVVTAAPTTAPVVTAAPTTAAQTPVTQG